MSNFYYTRSGNASFSMTRRTGTGDWAPLGDYIQLQKFLDAFAPALASLPNKYVNLMDKYQDNKPTIMNPVLTEEELKNTLLHNDGISESAYIADALKYTLTDSRPRFTVVFDILAHTPWLFNEDGKKRADEADEKNYEIMSYPADHRYAAKVLINLIDMILRNDPEAVIVLQADHGPKCPFEEVQFAKNFRNPNAIIDLLNNVMSAIRVPKQFRNGEESYASSNPLNVSRYIVNNFVGRNYEYISTDMQNRK
jgi:hypothetical protein